MKTHSSLLAIAVLALSLTIASPDPASAATVTLYPNASGWTPSGGILSVYGAATGWQACASDDGDTSYVYTTGSGSESGFYNLTDTTASGTINSVTVYIKVKGDGTYRIGTRLTNTEYHVSPTSLPSNYDTYSASLSVSPATGTAWTWDEINNLQAGVALKEGRCTLIWVVVDYTPSDNEGLSHGYWKNHTEDWEDYDPSDVLDSVFDFPAGLSGLGTATLAQALAFKGGDTLEEKAQILLRNAVAAVLNAAHPNINYPRTLASVITDVNAALGSENTAAMLILEAALDTDNNLGGDINS